MDTNSTIESILHNYCATKIDQAATIDSRYQALWQEIDGYLAGGGKRIRPRLILLAYDAYGGKDREAVAPIAAAWELLHASLLVHDDIIDRDTVRHGQPNIAGRYVSIYEPLSSSDTSHYALSAALLGGNLLLMGAYELTDSAPIPNDLKLLVHSFIHRALFTVAGGELIDTDSILYPIDQSNPQSVAKHKTASYSLQLPLQCGAALAGASPEELEKLSLIGLHTGIAYQFQDDLLGVFGDSAITGKSNRSDIIEKKRTALIHQTIAGLESDKADIVKKLFSSDRIISADEAEEVVQLITSSGAKQAIEETIKLETDKALSVIETLNVSSEHKEIFKGIIAKLTTRTS